MKHPPKESRLDEWPDDESIHRSEGHRRNQFVGVCVACHDGGTTPSSFNIARKRGSSR